MRVSNDVLPRAPLDTDSRGDVRRESAVLLATGRDAGITPADVREARRDLGRQLAAWRDAAGVTRMDLARVTCYGRTTIANVEAGQQNVRRAFWLRADRELGAGGFLLKAFEQVDELVRDYNEQVTRGRERERHQRTTEDARTGESETSAATGPDRCGCGLTVARWDGREARALREAMRQPVRAFAEFLGVAVSTVSNWESNRSAKPLRLSTQDVLDQALKLADADVRARFRQLIDQPDDALPMEESSCAGPAGLRNLPTSQRFPWDRGPRPESQGSGAPIP